MRRRAILLCNRIPIITTHHAIRVQNWNQDEGVEFAEKLCLFSIRCEKIEDSFEYGAGWSFARVHSRRYYNSWFPFHIFGVSRNRDVPNGESDRIAPKNIPFEGPIVAVRLERSVFGAAAAEPTIVLDEVIPEASGCARLVPI